MTKIASFSVKPFMVKWLFEITKYLKRVTWAIQNICGSTVWFNIQLVPKTYFGIFVIYFCRVIRNQMYTESESDQIFVIWRKWGARYTFWYIVLLTLCNGDRHIVNWSGSSILLIRAQCGSLFSKIEAIRFLITVPKVNCFSLELSVN